MMNMTNSEAATAAADLIEEKGWSQGPASLGESPCAVVALSRVIGQPRDEGPFYSFADFVDPGGYRWFASTRIVYWNDAPGQTKANVVTTLRAFAAAEKNAGR
jgi:hypothetical protein